MKYYFFATTNTIITSLLLAFLTFSCSHHEGSINRNMYLALDNYGRKIATENSMKYLYQGNKGLPCYFMTFSSGSNMSIDQGRALIIGVTASFLHMIPEDPDIKAFLEANKTQSYCQTGLENTGIRIDFWDKDMNRLKHPYLAEVLLINKTISYFEADPTTQALRLVHKESYSDAQKILGKS